MATTTAPRFQTTKEDLRTLRQGCDRHGAPAVAERASVAVATLQRAVAAMGVSRASLTALLRACAELDATRSNTNPQSAAA